MPPEAGWVLTAPQTLFHLVWSLWCITIAVLLFAVNFVCVILIGVTSFTYLGLLY